MNRTNLQKGFFVLFLVLCHITLGHSICPAENKLVKKAWKAMDFLAYEDAVKSLEHVLLDKPNIKEVRTLLAFAYYRLDKHEEALESLREELTLFPDNFNALILQGVIHFNRAHYDLAAKSCLSFDSAIENAARIQARKEGILQLDKSRRNYKYFMDKVHDNNPNFGLPYFILGFNFKRKGDFKKAANNYIRALELGYDPVECRVQLMNIELINENWRGALDLSKEAVDSDGPKSEYYFLMGTAYYQLGDALSALSCFKKAVELKPYQIESLKNLAKTYLSLNKINESILLLERALKLESNDQELHMLLNRITDNDQIQKEETKPKLSKNFQEKPELQYKYTFLTNINEVIWAMNASALQLLRTGRIDAAGNLMKSFLEIHESSPELNYNLAKLYEFKDSLGNALKYAWRAKELKEDYKNAYDLIANIFYQINDFNNAIKFYEKVIEFDPKDAMSYYNLGCTYFAAKDLEKAEKHLRKAIENEKLKRKKTKVNKSQQNELKIEITVEVTPISFRAHMSLGHLYLEKNLRNKALEEFTKAMDIEPEKPDSYYEVGKIHFELKNEKKALFYLNKSLSLGGDEKKIMEMIKSIKDSGEK